MIEKLLLAKGLRATPHRVRIAQKVLAEHCHFSAEEICQWSEGQRRRMSRATVYNILNEFVSVGLLRSFFSSTLSRTIYDSNTASHFHFHDTKSDQIMDIDPSLVKINTSALKGYQIEGVEILFRGQKG